VVTVSHCADDARLQGELVHSGNRTGAVLFGALLSAVYPLRARWAVLLRRGLVANGTVHAHPGWSTLGVGSEATGVSFSSSEQPTRVRRHYLQYEAYLQRMANARLCLLDSSYRRLWLRKFSEAMLAGCVVVSDDPLDWAAVRRRRLFVSVDGHALMSDAALADVMQRVYSDASGLAQVQRRARRFALRHLTCQAKVTRILDAVARFRGGERGLLRGGPL